MDDDLRYAPLLVALDWVRELDPATCLVLGSPSDETVKLVASLELETRSAGAENLVRFLHNGAYAFRQRNDWHIVIAAGGKEGLGPTSGRSDRLDDSHHLVMARLWHEGEWGRATSFVGNCTFDVGNVVTPQGESIRGRIKRIVRTQSGHRISVEFDGRLREFGETSLHLVEGDPGDPEWWIDQPPASAESMARTLTFTKLRHPLTDTLYSFAASKTVFRPYQFIPALKLLNSATGRLLIADEVGLGKTIEAGLIWTELEQREPMHRALVVTPASLVVKWQREMQRRFDRPLPKLTPTELREFARRLKDGQEPDLIGIISLESLRSASETLTELTEVRPNFQLVIVDEAHALRNRGNKSHVLGQLLSDWSEYLLFLTATPLNLASLDLFNLVNLLSEADFGDHNVFEAQIEPNGVLIKISRMLAHPEGRSAADALRLLETLPSLRLGAAVTAKPAYDMLRTLLKSGSRLENEEVSAAKRYISELNTLSGVLTRTRKIDVPDRKATREVANIDVVWTEGEREFYENVREWCLARASANGVPPGFALQMPMRQAASSIPAMQRLLREKLGGIAIIDSDDSDATDEEVTTEDVTVELLMAQNLLTPLEVDTKYSALLARLLEARSKGLRQVMIFSFFRRTIEYLAENLAEAFTVRFMHGGTRPDDRQLIMDDFRSGKFEVLLVSEVGSEGLDFEFCNVLVNYDLPWNPMRVEQRIGRLDRFGQEHEKIFIYNMHVPGTIETDIFERLYQRIGLFEASIGELEPILRDEIGDIGRRVLDPKLSARQRAQEIDRLAVAFENRKGELERLDESRAVLSTVDQLEVDGMTPSGPTDGRFIGASEIEGLLRRVLTHYDGKMTATATDGIWALTGSDGMASAVRSLPAATRRAMPQTGTLSGRLRDREPIRITFNSDIASKHDVDLMSSRHPLIRVAVELLSDDVLNLARYGSLEIPGLTDPGPYLVSIDLVESNGLRPRREMWATSANLADGRDAPDVGSAVLSALAEGQWLETSQPAPGGTRKLYGALQERIAERCAAAEDFRRRENSALVEGRLASQLQANMMKQDRVRQLLQELGLLHTDARIVRLHEGRLRGLDRDQEEIRAHAAQTRGLSLSREPIAVLVVHGTSI